MRLHLHWTPESDNWHLNHMPFLSLRQLITDSSLPVNNHLLSRFIDLLISHVVYLLIMRRALQGETHSEHSKKYRIGEYLSGKKRQQNIIWDVILAQNFWIRSQWLSPLRAHDRLTRDIVWKVNIHSILKIWLLSAPHNWLLFLFFFSSIKYLFICRTVVVVL